MGEHNGSVNNATVNHPQSSEVVLKSVTNEDRIRSYKTHEVILNVFESLDFVSSRHIFGSDAGEASVVVDDEGLGSNESLIDGFAVEADDAYFGQLESGIGEAHLAVQRVDSGVAVCGERLALACSHVAVERAVPSGFDTTPDVKLGRRAAFGALSRLAAGIGALWPAGRGLLKLPPVVVAVFLS